MNELETRVRKELQEKLDVVAAEGKQREAELLEILNARSEACEAAEKERDEERQAASEAIRQVHDLKGRLMEVSSVLTGWKGGAGAGKSNGNGKHGDLAVLDRDEV